MICAGWVLSAFLLGIFLTLVLVALSMTEIKPTSDHLSDPYVLQLIEALSRRDDEIESLSTENGELKIERAAMISLLEANGLEYKKYTEG